MWVQKSLTVSTHGRGSYDISMEIQRLVAETALRVGLCHVFVHHTSASLMLCENADPTVRSDLEAFMGRLVPDGDRLYQHTAEGADDMPAHVRAVLTQNSLTLPVSNGRCTLGTWQGVYLWEHRTAPHRRRVTLTLQGE